MIMVVPMGREEEQVRVGGGDRSDWTLRLSGKTNYSRGGGSCRLQVDGRGIGMRASGGNKVP